MIYLHSKHGTGPATHKLIRKRHYRSSHAGADGAIPPASGDLVIYSEEEARLCLSTPRRMKDMTSADLALLRNNLKSIGHFTPTAIEIAQFGSRMIALESIMPAPPSVRRSPAAITAPPPVRTAAPPRIPSITEQPEPESVNEDYEVLKDALSSMSVRQVLEAVSDGELVGADVLKVESENRNRKGILLGLTEV